MPIRFHIPLPGPFVWVPNRTRRYRSRRTPIVPRWVLLAVLLAVWASALLIMWIEDLW